MYKWMNVTTYRYLLLEFNVLQIILKRPKSFTYYNIQGIFITTNVQVHLDTRNVKNWKCVRKSNFNQQLGTYFFNRDIKCTDIILNHEPRFVNGVTIRICFKASGAHGRLCDATFSTNIALQLLWLSVHACQIIDFCRPLLPARATEKSRRHCIAPCARLHMTVQILYKRQNSCVTKSRPYAVGIIIKMQWKMKGTYLRTCTAKI